MCDNCNDNATCENEIGRFTYRCNDGYSGDEVNCDDVGECDVVLMNVTLMSLVLTMKEAMTARETPVTLVMADNVLTLLSVTSLKHVMPMPLVKILSVAY